MDLQASMRLRKVKPFYFENARSSMPASSATSCGPPKARRLLKIDFKNPNTDYTFIRELKSNQGTLVCHQGSHLHLAVIRESFTPNPLPMLAKLAQVQHPNIAEILALYYHNSKLYIVSEYLDVSLLDLELNIITPEEWEIATIVAEVISSTLCLFTRKLTV